MIKFRDITILISHVEMHNDLTSESEILRVEMHGYIIWLKMEKALNNWNSINSRDGQGSFWNNNKSNLYIFKVIQNKNYLLDVEDKR